MLDLPFLGYESNWSLHCLSSKWHLETADFHQHTTCLHVIIFSLQLASEITCGSIKSVMRNLIIEFSCCYQGKHTINAVLHSVVVFIICNH